MLLTAKDARRVLQNMRARLGRARTSINSASRKSKTKRPSSETFSAIANAMQDASQQLQLVADSLSDVLGG
jgi:hypothetical protein